MRNHKAIIGTCLLALSVAVAGVVPAQAASKGGSLSCGYVYAPKVTSKTTGYTTHSYVDRPTNSYILFTYSGGGTNTSWGSPYKAVNWNVTAPTISSTIATCAS